MNEEWPLRNFYSWFYMITDEQLNHWFTYHKPDAAQQVKYETIRSKAIELARAIRDNSPASADQSDAIRKVREAVMTANAAIALGGR